VETLAVPPAVDGSCEALLRQAGHPVAYWLFAPGDLPPAPLGSPCGQRAIGVVYQPELDARDNYLASVLPWRYDALIFIETSQALSLPDLAWPNATERP
jgi:erythromycin esterase-like protein